MAGNFAPIVFNGDLTPDVASFDDIVVMETARQSRKAFLSTTALTSRAGPAFKKKFDEEVIRRPAFNDLVEMTHIAKPPVLMESGSRVDLAQLISSHFKDDLCITVRCSVDPDGLDRHDISIRLP